MIDDDGDLEDALHSAFALLLPQLEEAPLYNSYDFNVSWRDPVNVAVGKTPH